MPRRFKLTPFHSQIGTVPDREIARLAGCSIATVCHYRQRHNIPSYRSTLAGQAAPLTGTTAPTVVASTPPTPRAAPPAGSQGYTAILQTTKRELVVLIAADIVEAAEKASAVGTVVRLTHVGEAI